MKDEYLSVVYSHWISFIHSSIGRHLHWFHNSALLNSATVSTVTQASILPNDVRTSGWIPGARSCWVPWPFFWFVPLSTITLLTRILINRGGPLSLSLCESGYNRNEITGINATNTRTAKWTGRSGTAGSYTWSSSGNSYQRRPETHTGQATWLNRHGYLLPSTLIIQVWSLDLHGRTGELSSETHTHTTHTPRSYKLSWRPP